jgi:hypothetical protein
MKNLKLCTMLGWVSAPGLPAASRPSNRFGRAGPVARRDMHAVALVTAHRCARRRGCHRRAGGLSGVAPTAIAIGAGDNIGHIEKSKNSPRRGGRDSAPVWRRSTRWVESGGRGRPWRYPAAWEGKEGGDAPVKEEWRGLGAVVRVMTVARWLQIQRARWRTLAGKRSKGTWGRRRQQRCSVLVSSHADEGGEVGACATALNR